MNKKYWLVIIVVLILTITYFHYHTPTSIWQFHLILMQLYFIPILLAAFQFGVKGGVISALAITVFYLPHVFLQWGGLVETNLLRFLQVLLFNVIGYLTGLKAEGERKETEKYRKLAEKLKELNEQQKQQSELLLEMERKLRMADRLAIIGELTASLAHEVRNPLASIRGSIQILKEQAPENLKASEFFTILEHETQRINTVVDNYLNFARRPAQSKSTINLYEVLDILIKMVESKARKQNVSIQTAFEENLPLFDSDPNALKQVLMNLLLNGLQAMPEGGRLIVQARQDNGQLIISIIDRGKGMTEEQLEKIFQPFYTTKKEGTGLGLSIVKRIADENNWQIKAESKLNEGSRFDLIIPLPSA
ncbi:sensor histidine kinase [Caldithrix abyssi]